MVLARIANIQYSSSFWSVQPLEKAITKNLPLLLLGPYPHRHLHQCWLSPSSSAALLPLPSIYACSPSHTRPRALPCSKPTAPRSLSLTVAPGASTDESAVSAPPSPPLIALPLAFVLQQLPSARSGRSDFPGRLARDRWLLRARRSVAARLSMGFLVAGPAHAGATWACGGGAAAVACSGLLDGAAWICAGALRAAPDRRGRVLPTLRRRLDAGIRAQISPVGSWMCVHSAAV